MFCPKCGTENENIAQFCSECGNSLKEFKEELLVSEDMLEDRIEENTIYENRSKEYQNENRGLGTRNIKPNELRRLPEIKIGKVIILSLLTMGIYLIYTLFQFNKTVNELCEGDGRKTPNYFIVVLLGILTLGVYMHYWIYTQANRLHKVAPRYGCKIQEDGAHILMWSTFGQFIGIGPLIGWYRMFKNVNRLIVKYNRGRIKYDFSFGQNTTKNRKAIVIIVCFYGLLAAICFAFFFWILTSLFGLGRVDNTEFETVESFVETELETVEAFEGIESETETTNSKQSEDVTQQYTDEDYLSIYEMTMASAYAQYEELSQYALYDFDKDGIKELVISAGMGGTDWRNDVYTLEGGEVSWLGIFQGNVSLYETEDRDGVYAVKQRMDVRTIQLVKKTGNVFSTEFVFDGEVDPNDNMYHNDYPIPLLDIGPIMQSETTYGGDNTYNNETEETTTNSNMFTGDPNYTVDYSATDNASGYMFSQSSEFKFTGYPNETQTWIYQYGINEIYAKHGYVFQSQEVQALYDMKTWYQRNESYDASQLTEIELYNIDYFTKCIEETGNDGGLGIPWNEPSGEPY